MSASNADDGIPPPRDEDIWARIPEVDGDRRIAFCSLGYLGAGCSITYQPRVDRPHQVVTRVVVCGSESDIGTCKLMTGRAWFDAEPMSYFELGAGLRLADVLPVVQAYSRHGVVRKDGTPWSANPQSGSRILAFESAPDGFLLLFANCGCSARIRVEPRQHGGRTAFEVVAEEGACY